MLRLLALFTLFAAATWSSVAQSTPPAAADAAKAQNKSMGTAGAKPGDKSGDKKPEKPAPPVVTQTVIPMQDAPAAYRAIYMDARYGPALQVTMERKGSRVAVESGPAGGTHIRSIYDLAHETRVSWVVQSPAGNCVQAAFSGDWGDPFAASIFNGMDTHFGGLGTSHGLNANIMEGPGASGGTARAWFDTATSLLLHVEETTPSGAVAPVLDLTSFERAVPSDAAFAVPPACSSPATPDELRTQLLGKHAAEFAPANAPPAAPDGGSCTVLFRVAMGEKLLPVTRGYQVAVDLAVDPAHLPAYQIDVTPEGHATFAGGQLYERTGQLQEGLLRIENAPASFEIDTEFGSGGSAHALIRRQCSAPETSLLLVVRDPSHPADSYAWVWTKPAKPAAHP